MIDDAVLPPHAGSAVPHVGSYRRVLPVSLERMYENALDWEHLPHLHASSFSAIDCIAAGDWGWRAEVRSSRGGERSVLELALDRSCRRWITRNLDGPHAGAEIWTQVWPRAEREIEIVVDFFVPGVARDARTRVGQSYARLYRTLYDEDEAMMCERQRRLDARRDVPRQRIPVAELPARVRWRGREFVIEDVSGQLRAWPSECPHLLGPLARHGKELRCPWHGYRFDIDSGRCLTGQSCRLPEAPTLLRDGADLILD